MDKVDLTFTLVLIRVSYYFEILFGDVQQVSVGIPTRTLSQNDSGQLCDYIIILEAIYFGYIGKERDRTINQSLIGQHSTNGAGQIYLENKDLTEASVRDEF